MAVEKKETKKTTKSSSGKRSYTRKTAPKAPKEKIAVDPDTIVDLKDETPIEDAPVEAVEASVEPPKEEKYVVACKSVLNVRAGAGREYKVIRQIPNGTIVTMLDYNPHRMFGRIGDGEWVDVHFLKKI